MDTIKIRLHRGSLDESMLTMQEIPATPEAVRQYLQSMTPILPFSEEELSLISIKLYDFNPDKRIGWAETYLVKVFDKKSNNYLIYGFTDGMVEGLDVETIIKLKKCPRCNGTGMYAHPSKLCTLCKGKKTVAKKWKEPACPDIKQIRDIARECGYAVAEHGSKKRDYDIVAIPWTVEAVTSDELVEKLLVGLNARIIDSSFKPHGRAAFCIQLIEGWYRTIDLSITPTLSYLIKNKGN